MTDKDASYIIHEIKSIQYYETRIKELMNICNDISRQIVEVGEPHSPLGNNGPHCSNPVPQSTHIIELISEEQTYTKALKHYRNALVIAQGYKMAALEHTVTDEETAFAIGFANGQSYTALEHKHGCSNAYSWMRTIVKRIREPEVAAMDYIAKLK